MLLHEGVHSLVLLLHILQTEDLVRVLGSFACLLVCSFAYRIFEQSTSIILQQL